MNTVHINASKSYDIIIEKGLLPRCGSHIKNVCQAQTICLVTDDTVNALYADTVIQSLQTEGFRTIKFAFTHGEESKNRTTYFNLIDFLAENHMTRSDAIVALGGGVVGDLSGFAAATFLRGVSLIQIPTTLLACVDSSVGGKTAIDIPAGKNLLGAFYQPSLVLCDPMTLNTLPDEIYRDGCAEIIKYAMITDALFFEQLNNRPVKEWEEEVIGRCVEIKRDIVMQDEFDKGQRALLNLGHTIGHAIETCSHFTVSHGHAVAIGMYIITKAAEKFEVAEPGCTAALKQILAFYHFPLTMPYEANDLFKAALQDKKREGDAITLIVPQKIGSCSMHQISTENLLDWIHNGL